MCIHFDILRFGPDPSQNTGLKEMRRFPTKMPRVLLSNDERVLLNLQLTSKMPF